MSKSCTVCVNDEKFVAKRGDVLLDAALAAGVDMPHDCRSGHCGTCTVRVRDGLAIGGDCGTDGMVRACQARVVTDLDVLVEPVPDAVTTRGVITGLQPLAPDVVELRIHLAKPVTYLPGQYYKFQFAGFPARCFSPTAPMQFSREENAIRLHVRKVTDGRVSPELGLSIQTGHPVLLRGPYGAAYLRPGGSERLVLVSSGTGFAPIWSIARAAMRENPSRPMVLVLGSKDFSGLYMGAAARMLASMANVTVLPVVDMLSPGVAKSIRKGRPTDHLPALGPNDIVYACGAPPMVEAVRTKAKDGGATFYADPFVPQSDETLDNLFMRVIDRVSNMKMLAGTPRISAAAPPARLARPK
jgi:3-phenylpropionate/trans-cinnamate dioxygenase ferredoxin reductase subunit